VGGRVIEAHATIPGPVRCSEILLRGLQQKHLDWDPDARTFTASEAAFVLRRNEQYLSVDRRGADRVSDAFEQWPATFLVAAVSLHTGSVRDLGLAVKPVPEPANPLHAGIFGLPTIYGPEDEAAEAYRLASDLREQCRFVACRSTQVAEKARRRALEA
jgi:hypothetical protein